MFLIESGRQINDVDNGKRLNPGQERQKISLLIRSFNAAIDGIDHDSLQRLLDAGGVTKAYGLIRKSPPYLLFRVFLE